jgi:hypothetical protein
MIDAFVANQPHYVPYTAAALAAVPKHLRGVLYLGQSMAELIPYALRWGITVAPGRPPGTVEETHPVIVAGHQDIDAVPHGRPIIYVEHGAGQSYATQPGHPSYSGGTGRERVGLHLVPNTWTAAKTQAAWPETPCWIIGDPTIDDQLRTHLDLTDPEGPGKDGDLTLGDRVVAVTFHWDGHQVAPEAGTGWHTWAFPVLQLAQEEGLRVIGHAHPRIAHQLGPWWAEHGIEYVPDRDRVLQRADVLVADNTSLIWQAARLGIPTVVLDCPFYGPDARRHGPPRFDRHADVGVRIQNPANLPHAIEAAYTADAAVRDYWMSLAVDVYPTIGTAAAQQITEAVAACWG